MVMMMEDARSGGGGDARRVAAGRSGDDDDGMFANYLNTLTRHLSKYGHGSSGSGTGNTGDDRTAQRADDDDYDDGHGHGHDDDDDVEGCVGHGDQYRSEPAHGGGRGKSVSFRLEKKQGGGDRERAGEEGGDDDLDGTRRSRYSHSTRADVLESQLSPIPARHTGKDVSHVLLDDDLPALRTPRAANRSHLSYHEGDSGLEEQLGVYRQRDAIYQDELASLQKENSTLQQQVHRLRGELQRLSLETREGDAARAKCNEVEKMHRVEEQLKTEVRESQTQAHVLRQQINQQETTIHELKREVEDLRREVLETGELKNSAVEETRAVLREVTKERDEARQLYERVSKELSSRVAETKSLQQKVELEERVLAEERNQTALRDRHIQELQAKEAEFVRSERQLRAALTDADDVRESLLRKLSAQATTIRDLREAIDALSEQNQTLVSHNQLLRSGRDTASLPDFTPARFEGSNVQEKAAGRVTSAEADALQDELGKTLQQFARVFDLALARINNSDDDVRRLLGLSAQRDAPLFVRTTDVSSRLDCIREMQRFINKLETGISDAYARDVGHQACGIQ
ncbi:hypothetical protein PTSG_11945 [Salpingoeca rosetta]|uniref:Uncharacterized protein n=1 Tax=Salpingoeca rosetta (strain ATCC 50818 / BSB-021) TaxID=946362 RepID=F2U3W6_SALR5|nr:uncharacterized protein PTSG_11945 [Salpingoeca rosetta]EGD82310.1 hypothetical protein PTSG_11945 [Salpingoeca rosetta]|eukprot:XP_004996493.1 hypothetical protein PTSG_11945 [Salpingoeca rosetta]